MRKVKKINSVELLVCLVCITVCLICVLILLEIMFPAKPEQRVSGINESEKIEFIPVPEEHAVVELKAEPKYIQETHFVPAEITYTQENIDKKKESTSKISNAVYNAALDDVLNGMIAISDNNITRDEALFIYSKMIEAERKHGVSHRVLLSMCAQESNFINYKDSNAGSSYGRGPMMISDITRTDFYYKTGKKYTASDCYDWDKALEMACWAYKYNHTGYGVENNEKALIIAYNVGQKYYKQNRKYLLNNEYPSGKPYMHYVRVMEKMNLLGFSL